MDSRKSLFGASQSELSAVNNLLEQYNTVTTKLGDVKTVQDIIAITSQLSKVMQATNKIGKNDQVVYSK